MISTGGQRGLAEPEITAMFRFALAFAASLALLAGAAHAETLKVDTHGLDLTKTQDMKVLTHRVDNAALAVCADEGSSSQPFAIRQTDCFKAAYGAGMASARQAQLAAIQAAPTQIAAR
jgi:UrcA family protein